MLVWVPFLALFSDFLALVFAMFCLKNDDD
jgi:hypothetical protein